jgi:hypothetical protein
VIHSLQKIAEMIANNYRKFEVIDSIRMSDNSNLAQIAYMNIVDILLDDIEIKDIFLHGDIISNKIRPQENDRRRELLMNTVK